MFWAIAAGVVAGEIRFQDVTEEAGLLQPLKGIMGHGGAVGDVDGDGLPDLLVGGFADRPSEEYAPAEGPVSNVLLRNLGGGKFVRLDQKAVESFARTSGAVFADLDNDGDVDLYVANNTKGKSRKKEEPQRTAQLTGSQLFRNDGGILVDVSEASGACPIGLRTARSIGVFDYDNDGLLDLLVLEDRFIKEPKSLLFRNLGGMKFEEANESAGLPDDVFGLGLAVADVNEDGRPDFFVGHSNRLFLSVGKNRYRESKDLNKVFEWTPLDGEDWPCGAAFGDLNRDGRLDLVLSIHHVVARNRVYLNEGVKDGVPRFRDVTKDCGLPESVPEKSPHVEIQDFDNDGWPDLYFSTAWMNSERKVEPLIYRNAGEEGGLPKFEGVREKRDGEKAVYYPAGPSIDADGDGKIDLFLINWFRGNHCRLLRNDSEGGNWLAIEVKGKTFNWQGIGTRVRVLARGKLLGVQELSTGYGYASGQLARCHFGLGKEKEVDLELLFPGGGKKMIKGVRELNRVMTIEE